MLSKSKHINSKAEDTTSATTSVYIVLNSLRRRGCHTSLTSLGNYFRCGSGNFPLLVIFTNASIIFL